MQTDLQLATSAPVLQIVRSQLGTAPADLGLGGGPDQCDLADRRQLQPGASRPHRQRLRESVRRADPEAAINNLTAAQSQLHTQIKSLGKQIKSLQGKPVAAPRSAP